MRHTIVATASLKSPVYTIDMLHQRRYRMKQTRLPFVRRRKPVLTHTWHSQPLHENSTKAKIVHSVCMRYAQTVLHAISCGGRETLHVGLGFGVQSVQQKFNRYNGAVKYEQHSSSTVSCIPTCKPTGILAFGHVCVVWQIQHGLYTTPCRGPRIPQRPPHSR